jgi:hypothetical protein
LASLRAFGIFWDFVPTYRFFGILSQLDKKIPKTVGTTFYLQVIQTGNGLGNVSTITPAQIYATIKNFYDGNWHHYVWTLTYSSSNTSTYVIYQDGVLKGTFSGNWFPTVSTPYNYIGRSNYGAPNQTGYIDDFRMYSKVLSSTEVTSLYQ